MLPGFPLRPGMFPVLTPALPSTPLLPASPAPEGRSSAAGRGQGDGGWEGSQYDFKRFLREAVGHQ